MDHSDNIHRNDLKRPRRGSLDDEPDRPPPQHPDGTHRTQSPSQREVHLAQDLTMGSVSLAVLDGSPAALDHPPNSSLSTIPNNDGLIPSVGHIGSGATSLIPALPSGPHSSMVSMKTLSVTNKTYLGGTNIENSGSLTVINNVYNQSSSPAPGGSSSRLDQSTTTNAIRPSSATGVENQGIPMPVTSTSTRQHLVQALKPSSKAHYKYYPEGQQSQLLRRATCTEGTRIRILEAVSTWINDTSDSAESVYWLFGLAGSGKSTIAYTVATHTEEPTSSTILGANFFCSRQFDETRSSKRVVPTVAYHLSQHCPSFADALAKRDFEVIHQNPRAQLEEFLAKPWLQSAEVRGADPHSFLVIIDALDEIEAEGGTDFLRSLLDTINDQQLPGLKFFVTSRPNPTIVRHVESFGDKKIYRLEEIPIEEAEADIETYLNTMLPHFKGRNLLRQLIQLAAGLFIFAATVVKQVTVRNLGAKEQHAALKKFISVSTRTGTASTSSATQALDAVYIQVLTEAFAGLDDDVFASRLRILHAFLCAMEPTSAAVISSLLPDDADEDGDDELAFKDDPAFSSEVVANNVIKDLYSVLYFQNDNVFPYHKSFLDFIFDQDRSGRFWCDEGMLHYTLTESCFQIMSKGLRFNIADIPSSYLLDRDNPRLQDEAHLAKSIPLDLDYACIWWARHLAETDSLDDSEKTPLLTSLADFVHLPALFWIEAMNVLRQGAFCASDLRAASRWVPSNNDLASALAEAARFALYFSNSPASSSTPHLYISALVTWRHTAYPVSNWKNHFPNTPRFTSGPAEFALITIDTGSSARCVAISPSGEVIANGTDSGLVQVWDATNGKPVVHFEAHEDAVQSISFFKDRTWIATSSCDETVRIWEVETPKEVQVFRGHHGLVHAAAISPDETRIVSGHDDGFVLLWDVDTGNLVQVFEGHTGPVRCVGFSYSPARRICSGSDDCTVRVWDVASGQILPNGVLREHHSEIVGVAFSPVDHSMVSFGDDGEVWKWDPVTLSGKRFTECESGIPLHKGSLSVDGLEIVLVDIVGVEILDSRTGEPLRGFDGDSWDAMLSRDGAFGVTALANGLIQVWAAIVDAPLDESHKDLPDIRLAGPLAVSHDATKIVSSDCSAPDAICICIWDAKTGDLLHKFKGFPTRVVSTVFSEDDHTIFFLLRDKTLGRWDWPTGNSSTVAKVAYDGKLVEAAFSQGGSRVIYMDDANNVDVYDLSTSKTLHLDKHEHPVSAVALSWDGGYAALGTKKGDAVVWDISSGETIRRVLDCDDIGWIKAISFSCDSSRLACANCSDVCIWDVATGHLSKVLDGGFTGRTVSGVAFSPDGSILASASESRSITLWDTQTWELLDSLEGFTVDIESLTFSPNGKQVISVEGGVIRVWNVPPSAATVDPKGYRVEKKIDVSSGLLVCSRTGWLLEANTDDRIICLPQNNMVPDPSNILVLPPSTKDTSVSYSHTTLGPNWELCYAGPSLPSTGQ